PGLQLVFGAVPAHLPGVGALYPQHDPHRGGLAGTVGSDEPEDLPGPDGETQIRQGPQTTVGLVQAVQFEPAHRRSRSVLVVSPVGLVLVLVVLPRAGLMALPRAGLVVPPPA